MDNYQTAIFQIASRDMAESESIGEHLGRLLSEEDVIALIGPLGAGKTSLTRGIARGWGSPDRVTSPSYTFVQQYERPQNEMVFYHLDCYRLESEDDAETLGLDDLFAAAGPAVIEWGSRIATWLPPDHLTIEIEIEDDHRRLLTLKPSGPRSADLARHLRKSLSLNL